MGFWRKLLTRIHGIERQIIESISQYSEEEKKGILKLYHERMETLTKVNPNINPMVLSCSIPMIAAATKHGFQFEKMLDFWFKLAEKDIDPYYAIKDTVPAIANRFEEPQDFELLLDAIEKLVVALSELVTRRGKEIATKYAKGSLTLNQANQEAMNAQVMLRQVHELGVGAALFQTNVAPESIRDFILYGVRLTSHGIEPTDALGSIPCVVQVVRNANEMETLMVLLDKFICAFYTAFTDRGRPLYFGICKIAESSYDANRFGACLGLACELVGKGLRPYDLLEDGFPHILKEARNEDEFKHWLTEGHRMVGLGVDPTKKFLTLTHG